MMQKSKQRIFLIGPMGTGKSSIGNLLAQKLNYAFYDSDVAIEQQAGTNLAWIFDLEGEAGLRQREDKMINQLTQKNCIVLATGGTCIASTANRHALKTRGIVIYLTTSISEQINRTAKVNSRRPQLRHNREHIIANLHQRYQHYYTELADTSFATDNHSTSQVAQQIVDYLGNVSSG